MLLDEKEVFPIISYWAKRYYRLFKNIVNDPDELFNIVYLGKIQNVTKIEHASIAIRQDIIDYLRKERRRNNFCCCVDFMETDFEGYDVRPEQQTFLADLDKIIAQSHLSIREQFIIFNYYYRNRTLQEIADEMGLAKSSVSKIHTNTLLKMQKIGEEQYEFLCGNR